MAPVSLPLILKWLLAFAVAAAATDTHGSCDADAVAAAQGDSMLLQVGGDVKKMEAHDLTESEDEDGGAGRNAGRSRHRRRQWGSWGSTRRRVKLDQANFKKGTVRITMPGTYELKEDIVFNPQRSGQSWSAMPTDSSRFPQRGGFFLGFFAAMAIEADNVELNCKGKEIKMSADFHKRQRFFSIIELGSSPFPTAQGPPQFASNLTTPDPPINANNVVIKNCKFGLSSHHSIHGNNNAGVKIKKVKMYDFEVGGVSLNGATNVVLEDLSVGPSLKHTFGAGLSQGIFLDHLASTLMEQDAVAATLKRSKTVRLRGQDYTAQAIFDTLRTSLQQYVESLTGPMVEVAGDGQQLPDGSAVYGVLLHRAGVAVSKLGICPDDDHHAYMCNGNKLEDIHIFDLSLKVDQVTNYVVDGQIVAGPAGDVFQVTRAWDTSNCHQYKGNVLMDAEIAIGALCAQDLAAQLPAEEFKSFCGGCYMPASVLAWASGDQSCQQTTEWAASLTSGTLATESLTCEGDAMNHHNKGAIALRLGFQEDISVEKVLIEDIVNHGVPNAAPFCKVENYEGVDVRAASLAHIKSLHEFSVKNKGALQGTDPLRVYPITGFLQMRGDDGPREG